jgi:hypothetical protein
MEESREYGKNINLKRTCVTAGRRLFFLHRQLLCFLRQEMIGKEWARTRGKLFVMILKGKR